MHQLLFPTMVKWFDLRSTKMNIEHSFRKDGQSNDNLKRLLNLVLDMMLAFFDKPIRLVIKAILFLSFLFSIITLFRWFDGTIIGIGYMRLIIFVWLLSGTIISTSGIIVLYIGKTFEGVNDIDPKTTH